MKTELTATLSTGRRGELLAPVPNRAEFRVRRGRKAWSVAVEGGVVTAGRSPENDVVLDGEEVSAVHVEFRFVPGGAAFRDLGSKNGVLHGMVRVKEGVLPEGEEVSVGGFLVGLRSVVETEEACSNKRKFGEFLGMGTEMGRLFSRMQRIAETGYPVLLLGETGVGKELLASGLHAMSKRSSEPYHPISCGALPPSLIESELFGHERGAFTGATKAKKGIFERAYGGTVFLDEVGELPLEQQALLLRVLDPGMIRRLGDDGEERRVDVRIIAATNRDLRTLVNEGSFRADLYFRLNVARVEVPPLRERSKGNVVLLTKAFARVVADENDFEELVFSRDAMRVLSAFSWPGNVRELLTVVRAAAIEADLDRRGGRVVVSEENVRHLLRAHVGRGRASEESDVSEPYGVYVRKCQKHYAQMKVDECDGNKVAAARRMGISRSQLYRLLSGQE